MIEIFVRRPAMTAMFVLVFVVLGLVAAKNLIIENTPKVEFPMVSVKAVYFGASPEEIDEINCFLYYIAGRNPHPAAHWRCHGAGDQSPYG